MIIKELSKKGVVISVVCILILVNIPSINGNSVYNQKKEDVTEDIGKIKMGFIVGYFDFYYQEEDLLVLQEGVLQGNEKGLFFIAGFRVGILQSLEQIKLAKFNNCIFINKFVIGFCRVYLPQSDFSMQIISQNDEKNLVELVIDGIDGDKIWPANVKVELYNESGKKVFWSWSWGWSTYGSYYSIGDKFSVCSGSDGYFSFKLREEVSGDVLFESPLVKF